MAELKSKWMRAGYQARPPGRTTDVWTICSISNGWLGEVFWYSRWRQYVFSTNDTCVFSAGCLEDLAGFIKTANDEHRKGTK